MVSEGSPEPFLRRIALPKSMLNCNCRTLTTIRLTLHINMQSTYRSAQNSCSGGLTTSTLSWRKADRTASECDTQHKQPIGEAELSALHSTHGCKALFIAAD